MIIKFDELSVYFPYGHIYPEQYFYMKDLKSVLDAGGHCVLEMPSGTGKTISLLSLVVAYLLSGRSEYTKLVYCSRTVPELDKVAKELEDLLRYIEKETGQVPDITAVALSSRKNLCLHPLASSLRSAEQVNGKCYSMTAAHLRQKRLDAQGCDIEDIQDGSNNRSCQNCKFFEGYNKKGIEFQLPCGVFRLSTLRQLGKCRMWCPYFIARQAIHRANVVIYSFHYLLDPKICDIVSRDIGPNTVVIFDEAHNIDNVCIESMSIHCKSLQMRSEMLIRQLLFSAYFPNENRNWM